MKKVKKEAAAAVVEAARSAVVNEVAVWAASESVQVQDFRETTKKMYQVNPLLIQQEEYEGGVKLNVRDFGDPETVAHIRELADNIRANGLLKPLDVRREKAGKDENGKDIFDYFLVDGECRLRAIRLLAEEGFEIKSVDVVTTESKNKLELTLNMLNANIGRGLSAIEQGRAYKRFIICKWTPQQIAERVGKSVASVKNALSLLETAPEIQEALVERRISANTVLNMTTRATKEEKEKTTLKEREAKLREIVKAQKEVKKKDVFAKKPASIPAPAPVYVQVDAEKEDSASTISISSENVRTEEDEFVAAVKLIQSKVPSRDRYFAESFKLILNLIKNGDSLVAAIDKAFEAKEDDFKVAI